MLTTKGTLKVSNSALPIAPEALAELNPIIPETYYFADRMGIDLERQHALYGEIYRRQPWVRAVIDKRANAVARLPVECWDVDGATRSLDTSSGYARLLRSPCYMGYLPAFAFWNWLQTMIDIFGEAYLAVARDGNGAPVGLMPMHPSRVAIQRDPKTGRYDYYFQAGPGIQANLVHFKQEDVVPFRLTFPDRTERGLSRLESVSATLFAEQASRDAVNAMWANGGRPNLVLETPGRLSETGIKRLQTAFALAHSGTTNAGKALVLEDGVTARPFQVNAVDLQLVESRRLNREEICAVYDIAPTLVGILDHATFSNITEQLRSFYRDTMAPVLKLIEDVMDAYIGSYWSRANCMRFATDEILRGDYDQRMKSAREGVLSGLLTPNEGRELVGLNRHADPLADELYIQAQYQRIGTPAEQIRVQTGMQGETPDGVEVTEPKSVAEIVQKSLGCKFIRHDDSGQFDMILSDDTLDRDGETLEAGDWIQPFPEHISLNVDHSRRVEDIVGSGRPFIDDHGNLRVQGTFATTDQAQHVRRLVSEGHAPSVSVEFMRRGAKRELLGGAFVTVPANPSARVLDAA